MINNLKYYLPLACIFQSSTLLGSSNMEISLPPRAGGSGHSNTDPHIKYEAFSGFYSSAYGLCHSTSMMVIYPLEGIVKLIYILNTVLQRSFIISNSS